MPIAAPLVIGAATLGAGALAAGASKSAANTAAQAQATANNQAIAMNEPWRLAGEQALGQQGDLLGLNGAQPQQAGIDSLKASPLYQSLFANGQEAIMANAAATGGLRGGNAQRSLADFSRDTLAQTIQQQVANLGNVSGRGQQAAAVTGNIAQDTGQAQAGASLAGGAANIGFIKDVLGAVTGVASNKGVQDWAGKLF